jgi:ABC-type antimicrobial peptide transport system permease subunit
LVVAVAGIAIGMPAAFLLAQFMRSMLFGVASGDARTYAGVAVILSIAALLASYLPARRAMRVDPVISLRAE